MGIWEDSTCHYHVQVELSVLCTFSDFVPLKENVSAVIFLTCLSNVVFHDEY